MPKFRVSGKAFAWVSTMVEAESKDSAIDEAYNSFGGVGGYCGNGGYDKLIGVCGSDDTIECDDFEFTDVEEAPEE